MRNIILFIAGVNVIAWGGCFLANILAPENPAAASIGVSIAAFGPLLLAIVLRKWARQGWRNAGLELRFKQNKGWYALSVFYTPLVIVLVATAALLFGVGHWNPERSAAVRSLLTTFGIVLGPMLFGSVGEEFGWRGYLEPALWSINQRAGLNHVVVGVVWGFWHFPILVFAPGSHTSFVQLLMVLLGCVALAILYGQMRIWSDSVWPCVILHAVSNTVMITVVSSKLLLFDDGVKDIISLNTTSVAVTGIWLATALVIFALLGKKSATRIARAGGA